MNEYADHNDGNFHIGEYQVFLHGQSVVINNQCLVQFIHKAVLREMPQIQHHLEHETECQLYWIA